MTAEEYWTWEGVRLLNQDGTIPTVEERVKEAYKKGYATGAEDSEVAIKAMDLWERHKELRENADRIGVNRYEALKKAESEVARLRGLLKDHATFLRKNGFDRQADDLIRFAPAPEEPSEKDTFIETCPSQKDIEWRELGPDEVIAADDEYNPASLGEWIKVPHGWIGEKCDITRIRTRRPLPVQEPLFPPVHPKQVLTPEERTEQLKHNSEVARLKEMVMDAAKRGDEMVAHWKERAEKAEAIIKQLHKLGELIEENHNTSNK